MLPITESPFFVRSVEDRDDDDVVGAIDSGGVRWVAVCLCPCNA